MLWTGTRRASSLLRRVLSGDTLDTIILILVDVVILHINHFVSLQDLGKLTKKLSKDEVASLLAKLDTDGDGQLSFEEFKVLFEKADKRKKDTEKKSQENLIRHHSAKVGAPCSISQSLMFQQSLHEQIHKTFDLSNTVRHNFKQTLSQIEKNFCFKSSNEKIFYFHLHLTIFKMYISYNTIEPRGFLYSYKIVSTEISLWLVLYFSSQCILCQSNI